MLLFFISLVFQLPELLTKKNSLHSANGNKRATNKQINKEHLNIEKGS